MKKILLLILFLNFNSCKSQTRESRFWDWVTNHKVELEEFINSDSQDYTIYNELTTEIKRYSPILFVEMTLTEKNEVVLIITPDGMKDGIEPTEKLFNSHPRLDNWIIKKFRQAGNNFDLNFNGVSYPSSSIQVIPQIDKENGKVHTQIYIENMNSNVNDYQSLAFLYLDHILGEYNTMTKIGYIDFIHLEKDQEIDGSITIQELKDILTNEFGE